MNIQTTIRLSCALLMTFAVTALQAKTTESRGLSFTENKGQVTDQHYQPRTDIDFKMETPQGMNIFIGDGQLHYQWNKTDDNTDKKAKEYKIASYRLDVELQGANRNAEVISEGRTADYDQYYKEYLPLEGAKAYSYSKVTYKNIYPKIDWVLYSVNNELKYDFVVHAGGDPSAIKLKYAGATSLASNSGAITITTPFGSITEGKPYSYDAETKETIASSFLLNDNTLGFNIAAANRTIVIDPSVNWITYYGGSTDDFAKGLKADAFGNVYMSGSTQSVGNIASIGAHQVTIGGSSDGFLVKFNSAGVRQWGTYYGGAGRDYFTSIAIDPSGDVYTAGVAKSSTGISTPGAPITTLGAGIELMLIKFDDAGNRIWGTYCNGGEINGWTAFEGSAYICCDPSGNVFMNHVSNGTSISKFNSSGVQYWSNAWQAGGCQPGPIACDAAGAVYAAADLQNAGYSDLAMVKFTNSGISVFNITFGGAQYDLVCGLDVDASGNVYISGETTSPSGIATVGTNRSTLSPAATAALFDGYVMKFNSSGVKQWGTYIGSGPVSFRMTLAAGLNNKLYMAATDSYYGGDVNMYILNSTTGLMESSLTSFAVSDNYMSVAYSPAGYMYVAGKTTATTIATSNAHQLTLGGSDDAYLACLVVDTLVSIHQPFNDTVMCAGSSFKLPYDVNSNFAAGNTFTAYLSDASGSFASPVSIGSITSSVADTIVCTIPLSTPYGTGYRIRIAAGNPIAISEDNSMDIRIENVVVPNILTYTATPGTTVLSSTSVNFSTTLSGVGATPTYQWKKNSVDISGANSATYTGIAGTDFVTNDTITVEVGSSLMCASPATITSTGLIMTVTLGIKDVNTSGWEVYPNPSNGRLTLTGNIQGTAAIQVMNMAGQTVYAAQAAAVNGKIRKEITFDNKLANGMYLLRITSGEATYTTRFSLEK
jgi:hypothetical protein